MATATADSELNSNDEGSANKGGLAPVAGRTTSDLVEGFNNLNILRQAGLMIGLAASVAIGFAVVLWTQGTDWKPLYGSLENLNADQITQVLDSNNITYKIDPNSGAMLVAADQLHQARLKLAAADLPSQRGMAGFELLDQEQPLGTSQFMETARYRRSLEGELARTITSIQAVRGARVHLAIPRQSVFVRDAREPRASVFLELYAGRPINPQQVRAISNLVANSIPEMKLENVSVVDQRGNLLSTGDENEELEQAAKQLRFTRKYESEVLQRINAILQPVVGSENFRAEVSADVDFTEVEQAEEVFNPDLPAIRSEQTLEEQRRGGDLAAGIPGALTNQPPGTGEAPEQAIDPATGEPIPPAEPENLRKQATRNYELDRAVSYTKHQLGKLQRLTVAVVVDDKVQVDPATGESVRVPWEPAELERLTILVRNAVGYSAARGDDVTVLNTPFLAEREEMITPEAAPWYQQDWFLALAKQLAGLFFVLLLLVGLVRPVMKHIAASGKSIKESEEARELAALQENAEFDSLSDETVTLTGGDALLLPSPEDSYEHQLNAIKGLIAEDPGRVAQVIKRWVNDND